MERVFEPSIYIPRPQITLMVKYGSLTSPLVDVRKEIRRIAKGGFDYVELGIEPPEGDPLILKLRKKQIKALLKKHKLPVIAHTAWWMDLSSPYEEVRRSWVAEAKMCIDIGHMLGAKIINFHSHSMGMMTRSKRKKIILNALIKSMKELVRYARKKKMKVVLENAAERGEITEHKDFKYVIGRVPGLYVHLDIGHAHLQGGMKGVEKFIKGFRKKIIHIHISDNRGKNDDHMPLGKGKLNLKRTIALLRSIGYDKTITFEIFTPHYGRDQVRSMKKFKALW